MGRFRVRSRVAHRDRSDTREQATASDAIEARREAERWAEDMHLGPLRREIVDDQSLVGRCGDRAVVLRGILLPA
jgi:hypothetical protein